jgi:hypothetical protein
VPDRPIDYDDFGSGSIQNHKRDRIMVELVIAVPGMGSLSIQIFGRF